MSEYIYHYLLTAGSHDHIKQDTISLKVPAQKGDSIYVDSNQPKKYEVMEVLHFVGTKTVLKLNEVKFNRETVR